MSVDDLARINLTTPIADAELLAGSTGSRTSLTSFFTCAVCQHSINISGRENQRIVKCTFCNEASALRPAPPGRKFIRCPCSALLTCKVSSSLVSCPRLKCKRVIQVIPNSSDLAPETVVITNVLLKVACVHCEELSLADYHASFFTCSRCLKKSSLRNSKSKYWVIMAVIFILLLGGSVFGVVFLLQNIHWQSAYLTIPSVGFIAGIFFLYMSIHYFLMKTSRTDLDGLLPSEEVS